MDGFAATARAEDAAPHLRWPEDAAGRVPYWVYTDPSVYRRELERIWYGPHWLYVGLECEVPEVGDWKTTTLGERPVIMVRSDPATVTVVENRCRHRGVKFCQARSGHSKELLCPYHQWSYTLDGSLQGVPFRRGVRRQGGMPADFDPKDWGLNRLKVEVANGVVWASFDAATPPFRAYLGEKFWGHYTRVYDGRKLAVLGYNRQHIPANWKLMQENIKDPYHAGLLHVFFVTFGLFRADQKSAVEMDELGRHGILISRKGEQEVNDITGDMKTFQADLKLADPRILDVVKEFPGDETVGMITVFPSVILQQRGGRRDGVRLSRRRSRTLRRGRVRRRGPCAHHRGKAEGAAVPLGGDGALLLRPSRARLRARAEAFGTRGAGDHRPQPHLSAGGQPARHAAGPRLRLARHRHA
ncbi:Rieske 2Fe-2S domain-containing protein [Leptolyngbya sp. 15MV]|nr:Rieske 2Fe-2S domain-containing protein [Leptolyngbya sp. 15MV]